MKETNGFKSAAEIRYLTSGDIEFYETDGELVGARVDGRDVGRVNILRLFPLHTKDGFLSVRRIPEGHRDRNTEIGIIEDLKPFSAEQRRIVNTELDRRYFAPKITRVKTVKEEFGHTYWETETTAGDRSFTTYDMGSSLIATGANSVIIVDADGSRYEVDDIRTIGDKAMKLLGMWL